MSYTLLYRYAKRILLYYCVERLPLTSLESTSDLCCFFFLLWNCINRVSKWSTFLSNILEGASDKTIFCLWIHCPRLMSSVGRCFGGLFETFSHYLQYLLTERANRRAVWFSLFSAGWLHWSNVCEGDWVGYKSVLPLWRRTRVCFNWPIICTSCS